MGILCILLFIHYIFTYRFTTSYIPPIKSDCPPMAYETGNAISINRHLMDEMLMVHHVSDTFMAHVFAYSLTMIDNSNQIGLFPIVDNSASQQLHVLYLPSISGDVITISCSHINDKPFILVKQNMSNKDHISLDTSFSETTTTATVMAQPFDHCYSAHLIEVTVVARPDETSMEHQIEDNLTVNRIENEDAIINTYIHSKLDGAISHCFASNGINRIESNSIITTTTTIPSAFGICTHSRPLRCLYMTVSRELLLVVCECWSYPSCKGRVDTACAKLLGKTTTNFVDSFFFLSSLTQQMSLYLFLFTYHDVLATYTCICISITDGDIILTQRWNASFFLQSYDGVIQLESEQGIGLRANNRPDLAADISRSFSILKHRSIFWIILFCVCVCVLMTLFNFLRVAMHDLVLSF